MAARENNREKKEEIMKTITPFSTCTEAMMWLDDNCVRCVKSKFYNSGSETTDYKCRLYYWISLGMISGEIPLRVAKKIGYANGNLLHCQHFRQKKTLEKKQRVRND